ncbi:MAG TPA: 7-carboxy-7-deazaguanine synthase QueE [Elusimicrobiales bacterium]|nr:7-carboxy-7-deazaguanine synthase QueE [Elusimicrobiales bacterium]
MKPLTAPVSEIFCSVQGEGLYCGQKQVFLRFAGCNLACGYCDEPAAAAGGPFAEMRCSEAAAEVLKLARRNRAAAVSLTGGEPLLNWKFIKALAPVLKRAGLAIHLETNGTLYRELEKIKGLVTVIAADIKLPSSTGGRAFWDEHARFLGAAPEKVFVKAVLTNRTSLADVKKAIELVFEARPGIPFFLQPATPRPGGVKPPGAAFMEKACCLAAARLTAVKVLPQQHPIWGVK